MYGIDDVIHAFRYPRIALREMNSWYYSRQRGEGYHKNGTNIMEEEWDILLILDACRYDMFSDLNSIKGRLESRISRGSKTSEFLRGNFRDNDLSDTVYTTGNPQLYRHHDDIEPNFYRTDHVWDSDRWDDGLGTVHPDELTEAAIENIERHPHKRHIVHYLQPHYPFIGSDLETVGRGMLTSPDEEPDGDFDIWGLQMRNEIQLPKDDIQSAYRSNLELVLSSIEELVEKFDRRIVVTSDHGNMVGDRSWPLPVTEWGHPGTTYTEALVRVPWLVLKGSERPDITAGSTEHDGAEIEDSVVEDRLSDLGYV